MRNYLTMTPALPSFSSEKKDLTVHEWIPVGTASGVDRQGPDLVGMARWAIHYLLHNPQKPLGCRCRFHISPLDDPPAPADDEEDLIAEGDTESRMDLEFLYMREMTGAQAGREVEEAIRSRLISYVRDDGLCWCSPRAAGLDDDPKLPAASPWATAYLLHSIGERYRRTRDERDHQLCRQLVDGLKKPASRRGNLMFYEGGAAPWRDGQWLKGCRDHYPGVLDHLVRYWEISHEDDVLEFAAAMAEGILQGAQRSLRYRIMPDGSHASGNCHLSMRTALGVALVGVATGNARYIEWARRVYEYTRSVGTDWGWYPENIQGPEYRYWSETCVTGDMAGCALALTRVGYSEHWDHLERAVRNYLPGAQFFLTPEFTALYRRVHANNPEHAEKGLQMLRKFEGGFLARQRPNDWVYRLDGRWQINMMGCCPPEGMRSLYVAWANTVVERDGCVFVNLALDCDAPAARVTTHAPRQGRLVVEARKPGDYHIRPPSWAPQEEIRAAQNDSTTDSGWTGAYLRFRDVKAGDVLQLDYPLPRLTQLLSIGCERSEELYEVRWVGNDIEEVSPRGNFLPIFASPRRPLPPLPTEDASRGELLA